MATARRATSRTVSHDSATIQADVLALGAATLRRLDGDETLRLGSLWLDRPCVLVLVRRTGCYRCLAAAQLLSAARAQFDALNVQLVAITHQCATPGDREDAAVYQRRFAGTVLADPSASAFKAAKVNTFLGFVSNFRSSLLHGGPEFSALVMELKAAGNGRGVSLNGSAVYVIEPGDPGRIVFEQRYIEDFPVADIVRALGASDDIVAAAQRAVASRVRLSATGESDAL